MNYYFTLFALFFASLSIAQSQGSLKGTVLDQEMNNEPLLFANVHLKNTSTSVETNFHGSFELNNLNAGKYILVMSYAGYETLEFPVEVKENDITIVQGIMKAREISLEDVSNIQPSLKVDTKTSFNTSKKVLK